MVSRYGAQHLTEATMSDEPRQLRLITRRRGCVEINADFNTRRLETIADVLKMDGCDAVLAKKLAAEIIEADPATQKLQRLEEMSEVLRAEGSALSEFIDTIYPIYKEQIQEISRLRGGGHEQRN